MFRKVVALSLLTVSFVAASRKQQDAAFAQIDSIVKTISEITGLTEKHPVAYGRMSKSELRKFLNKRIKKTLKPDEIYAEEVSLKMFGLIPQDFDLKKSTIDLLTEQAAAFYDYDEKKLFMLEDSSFSAETTTLAHELSHALADQYFNLDKFMDETNSNDDENLAHTAVVEGEASWLMIAYQLKVSGQKPVLTPEMVQSVVDPGKDSLADYPVLEKSPLYIQESLLFPYSEGTKFFDAVFQKLGKDSFATVFKDPPVDSAQIMHPEKYFNHEKPAKPDLPTLPTAGKTKEITDGSLGEFDENILLRQYLGEKRAHDLSGHFLGGQYKIVTLGKSKQPILLYVSQWDSDAKAKIYFDDYKKIVHAKSKQYLEKNSTGDTLQATTEKGGVEVHWKGDKVFSVEGMPAPADIGY